MTYKRSERGEPMEGGRQEFDRDRGGFPRADQAAWMHREDEAGQWQGGNRRDGYDERPSRGEGEMPGAAGASGREGYTRSTWQGRQGGFSEQSGYGPGRQGWFREQAGYGRRGPSGGYGSDAPGFGQMHGTDSGNYSGWGVGGYGEYPAEGRGIDEGGCQNWGQGSGRTMGEWRDGRRGAAGPHTGKGPRGYQRSDERIREEVCEQLTQHGYIDASAIEVSVSNGEVTLAGSVEDRRQKRLTEDVAESVAGVKDIQNQLRLHQASMGQTGRTQAAGALVHDGATNQSREPAHSGNSRG